MTKKEYSEEDGIVGPVGEPGPLGPPGADNSYGPKYYRGTKTVYCKQFSTNSTKTAQ